MLSEKTEQIVVELWDTVSAAGIAPNPYIAIEQIACLMFLKQLELDIPFIFDVGLAGNSSKISGASCTWSVLKEEADPGHHLKEVIFPWMRSLEHRFAFVDDQVDLPTPNGLLEEAYFQLDLSKKQALKTIITLIDQLIPADRTDQDSRPGEILEALVTQAFQKRKPGRAITPNLLTRFMVALLEPKNNARVIDPAAASGGFLSSVLRYQSGAGAADGASLVGVDLDYAMARISWINLYLHGVRKPAVVQGDAYSARVGKLKSISDVFAADSYDHVISNAPWGGTVENDSVENRSFVKDTESVAESLGGELLFLWRSLELLKANGRAAMVVSQQVLSSESPPFKRWRHELITRHHVEAVIQLPYDVFKPFTNTRSAVLVFRKIEECELKESASDSVWFYEAGADDEHHLWDALAHFYRQKRSHAYWEENRDRYYQPVTGNAYAREFDMRQCEVRHEEAKQVRQWLVPIQKWINDQLDPDCLEAAGWSMDIVRYRPIMQPDAAGISIEALIDELEGIEHDILKRLDQLRTLVGGE